MDVEMPLALDTSARGITVKKSVTSHSDASLDLIFTRTIGKYDVVGYYYGSLVYAELTKE